MDYHMSLRGSCIINVHSNKYFLKLGKMQQLPQLKEIVVHKRACGKLDKFSLILI